MHIRYRLLLGIKQGRYGPKREIISSWRICSYMLSIMGAKKKDLPTLKEFAPELNMDEEVRDSNTYNENGERQAFTFQRR